MTRRARTLLLTVFALAVLVATTGSASALSLGRIFADALIEPVICDSSSPISDYWGRAFLTARLEWIGAPKAAVDSPSPSDFGPVAASRLETVTWEGWQLRVPPLDLQRAVSQRRGLTTRVALIDALSQ